PAKLTRRKNSMESPAGLSTPTTDGGFRECTSLGMRSRSDCDSSGNVSSPTPTSTPDTAISHVNSEPSDHPPAVHVAASSPLLNTGGDPKHRSSEIRAMADLVAQARRTAELPPTAFS